MIAGKRDTFAALGETHKWLEVMSKQGGGLLADSTRFHNVLRDSAFRALERRQLDTEPEPILRTRSCCGCAASIFAWDMNSDSASAASSH